MRVRSFSNISWSSVQNGALADAEPGGKIAFVGDIMIWCPVVQRPVKTGLSTDTVVFDSLDDLEIPLRCSEPRIFTDGIEVPPGFLSIGDEVIE